MAKINCKRLFSIKHRRAFGIHMPYDTSRNKLADPHISNWTLARFSHNKIITDSELIHTLGCRIIRRVAKQRMNVKSFLKVKEGIATSVVEQIIQRENFAAIIEFLKECYDVRTQYVDGPLNKNPRVYEKINGKLYCYGRFNLKYMFIPKRILSARTEIPLWNGDILEVFRAEIILKDIEKGARLYEIIKEALKKIDLETKISFLIAVCSNEDIALAFEMFRVELGVIEAEAKENNNI